jgi:hypothetical protein
MFKKNIDLGFDIKWDNLPDDHHFKSTMTQLHEHIFSADSGEDLIEKNYYIINGLPIYYNKDDDAISIDLSGGADSTMIFYILCKIITALKTSPKIVAMTMIRFWETKSSTENISDNILNYFKEKFPHLDIHYERGFVPPGLEKTPIKNIVFQNKVFPPHIMENAHGDVYAVHNFNEYIVQKHKIKRSYGGVTTNPTHDVQGPAFRKVREFTQDDFNSYLSDLYRKDPFVLIQKDWVMAQYENFEIQDLRDMTRSCSSEDSALNIIYGKNNWTKNGVEYSCNKCFFCTERAWAQANNTLLLKQNHQ